MIRFKVDKSTVTVDCDHLGFTYSLSWNTGAIWSAQLLRNALAKAFRDWLASERGGYYDKGWKAAKAKEKKETEFDGW